MGACHACPSCPSRGGGGRGEWGGATHRVNELTEAEGGSTREALAQAKVEQHRQGAEPRLVPDEEVARVRVGVEDAIGEHLLRPGLVRVRVRVEVIGFGFGFGLRLGLGLVCCAQASHTRATSSGRSMPAASSCARDLRGRPSLNDMTLRGVGGGV